MNIHDFKLLKEATKKLTEWESSGKAFGHFEIISETATHENKADRIYEFFCLMSLLEDLNTNYKVELVPGSESSKIFPQSPAQKKGWPYFKIENKTDPNNKYQVCYGTNIKLSPAPMTTIAPDISIQKHDSNDDPDESMVEMIMDAKFKNSDTGKLTIDMIHAFIQRVNALKTTHAASIPLKLNLLSDIKANCLLTNGWALADQEEYCKLYMIKQVEQFNTEKSYNVVG